MPTWSGSATGMSSRPAHSRTCPAIEVLNMPRPMDASSYGQSVHTAEWTPASADRRPFGILAIVIYALDGCHIIGSSSPADIPWHEI